MGFPVIPQGADEVIEITLTDANGNAINPNDCLDVIVSVYQTKENTIQQWKLSDGDITVDGDGSAGIIQMGLDRNNTSTLPIARLFLEVCIETTNTEFEDDIQRQIATDIPLADLKNSVT
jgi:hypothetical protein